MKNSFGQNIIFTIFGESHGEMVGCVIDGLPAGIRVEDENIKALLLKRRPVSNLETARKEPDEYKIVSGVFNGFTTGSPVCILIPNVNQKSDDYDKNIIRPSHADYTGYVKYDGFNDYRGGGHFSGRVTAGIVAAGGILIPVLKNMGIRIVSHIGECAGIKDDDFDFGDFDLCNFDFGDFGDSHHGKFIKLCEKIDASLFPVINKEAGERMKQEIKNAAETGDSVGGIIKTAVLGVPAGIGEPFFDSVESLISHALFSIGGVKGVEFGAGFMGTKLTGSEFNDEFAVKNQKIITLTNNNGGINGGISNGMPILFDTAVKPTPSIFKKQQTVNLAAGTAETLELKGRHDPAIIRRICPVIDSLTALVICDLLVSEFGKRVLLPEKGSTNTGNTNTGKVIKL